MKRMLLVTLLCASCTLPAPAQTWEEQVQAEIQRRHELRLEEKKIEVLKRLQPDTNIYVSSKSTSSNQSTTGVSNVNSNDNL